MKNNTFFVCAIAVFAVSVLAAGCISVPSPGDVMVQIEKETGLKVVQIPNTTNQYLGKNHRGYDVLYSAQCGNVWGRYAARVAMGEIGREVGGIMGFLTGSYESGVGGVTGSPLDRLLSRIIGQPLSIMIVLKHKKPDAQRLDVLSSYAKVGPEDILPERAKVGWKAGSIYSHDEAFAKRLSDNSTLMKRMSLMRCEYIRVDKDAVTLLWSGSETDYSGMISEHGGYNKMLNAFMDNLADIADAAPSAKKTP